MWPWNRHKRREGFPANFAVQKIRIAEALAVSHLPPGEIAEYFRLNPLVAERLLEESYDKRYSPSTFIAEKGDEYRVGWCPHVAECERRFTNLADAATDYLLFSLGLGRWSPPEG
jgi:hypothetical protein